MKKQISKLEDFKKKVEVLTPATQKEVKGGTLIIVDIIGPF